MKKYHIYSLAILTALAACSPDPVSDPSAGQQAEQPADGTLEAGPEAVISEVEANAIPDGVRAAALAKIEGMNIVEAERKERDGKVFYDVEGTRPDGSEVELDMLEENGTYTVVEVQRDMDWADVPQTARAAAPRTLFTPVRVIESIQNDGTIIYELFEDGKPKEPAAEISLKDGAAKMLTERWKY